MTWPPNYRKIVLVGGDEFVIHAGGKGSLEIGVSVNLEPSEIGLTAEDQERLAPYEEWVEKNLGDDDQEGD